MGGKDVSGVDDRMDTRSSTFQDLELLICEASCEHWMSLNGVFSLFYAGLLLSTATPPYHTSDPSTCGKCVYRKLCKCHSSFSHIFHK